MGRTRAGGGGIILPQLQFNQIQIVLGSQTANDVGRALSRMLP